MSQKTFKTVVYLSSAGARRGRTESDPTPYTASKRKEVQKVAKEQAQRTPPIVDLGQPCLKCGEGCQGLMLHIWRKKCINCGCPPDSHKLDHDPSADVPYIQQLSLEDNSTATASQRQLRKYTWYPSHISAELVEKYMSSLPKECVPLKGSQGEKYRAQQFLHQLPAHDGSPEVCHKMTELEKKRLLKFVERRKNKFFGIGAVSLEEPGSSMVCTECSEAIEQGSVFVSAERASPDKAWHPRCFRCSTCKEILVDLLYFYSPEQDSLYCGRHHGELIIPRCAGCDELIFTSTYTEAQNQSWHAEHFCCSECDESVYRKPYAYAETNGKIRCERCYNKIAIKCQKCKEPIGIGASKLTHQGKCWHETCFVCKRCKEDLREQRYFLVDGELHCGDCMQPIAQCHGCKAAINPTVSYLQHKTRCWHAECFKCIICHTWLVDGQFHELDDSLMCGSCYIDKVSKKCTKCTMPIVGKGVQFSLKSYHQDCFTCAGCGENLGQGQNKVKERNGDPLCQDCALDFATKCFKCYRPITSKHTVYKSHPFHLECFTCNHCGVSVAKSEFYETSLNKILCFRCANV